MPSADRLRIGIDFDGTLADTIGAAARFLRDFDGVVLEPHEMRWPPGAERIGWQRFSEMISDHRFFERLTLVPGAETVMRSLSADADIFLITARTQAQAELARRWVVAQGLHLDGVASTSYESKVTVCRELRLDLHFDDMLAHTQDIPRETNTVLALLAAPWNDLQPSAEDAPAHEPRIHDSWQAFHDWAREAFEGRLGPR